MKDHDFLAKVQERLPEQVLAILQAHPGKVWLAGGFLTALAAGTEFTDYDLFVQDDGVLRTIRASMVNGPVGDTPFAESYCDLAERPVQLVTAYVFEDVQHLIDAFDFTINQAAVWWDKDRGLQLRARDSWWAFIKSRTLMYTSPGTFRDNQSAYRTYHRMVKYVQRGFEPTYETLYQVASALVVECEGDPGLLGSPEGY